MGFLDVLIGMIFIFGTFSLICTAINELIINNLMKLRAKVLKEGIVNMLTTEGNVELLNRFYNDPLIKSLHKPHRDPSYIPKRTFAMCILNQFIDVEPNKDVKLKDTAAINKLPDSVRATIERFVAVSNNKYDELITETENWFKNATDRMAGWYKRRMQLIGIAIAIVVTIAVNVDSIDLARYLYMNPVMREEIVKLAQEKIDEMQRYTFQSGYNKDVNEFLEPIYDLSLPLGWQNDPIVLNSMKNSGSEKPDMNIGFYDKFKNLICDILSQVWFYILTFLKMLKNHFFGWVLTVFAISLGAPFWFDLLRKIMKIRASGASVNDEFVQEEKS